MKEPLAWYIAGPLIGLFVPLIWILLKRTLGVSSSFVAIWNMLSSSNLVKTHYSDSVFWQVWFGVGLIIAGVSSTFFGFDKSYVLPQEFLSLDWSMQITNLKFLAFYVLGGVAIGLGSRIANGCTAGHCIYGMSQLSLGSLIATICFFIGGLFASYVLLPLIF